MRNLDVKVTFLLLLRRKLLDPGLSSSSRQNMFLNLLYKSLKADIVLRRVKAFVKRLLQVSAEQNASFACGALFLVSEVMKAKPSLKLLLQEDGVRSKPVCYESEKRRCLMLRVKVCSLCVQDGEEEEFKDLAEENDDDDDDEEERFVDADKLEEGANAEAEGPKPTASWVHHQNLEGL